MPYGTWIVREIESPKGFVLSEEEIAVTVGAIDEVVEISLVNYRIRGNIELTKVDKDYPENKLTGAVFEVYADTNENEKLDKDDELLGEMTELDGGVYQMKELLYGKYFVKETKPQRASFWTRMFTLYPSRRTEKPMSWKTKRARAF